MITPFDVRNLNESMAGLGDTFRTRRLDEEARRRDMAQELLRQEMARTEASRRQGELDVNRQRLGLEQQQVGAQTAQANKANKQHLLQTLMTLNSTGQLSDLDSVNEWLSTDEDFSKIGLQLKEPPVKATPETRRAAVVEALRAAAQYRAEGNNEYADMLEKWVQRVGTLPNEYSDVTTEEQPGALPGMPPKVKKTTKEKVPVGGAAPKAGGGKVITDQDGVKWIYTGSMADPKQDTNKANWKRAE